MGSGPGCDAGGAILAHSVTRASGRLKKGRRLNAADVAALASEGLAEVTVARLGEDDVPEDQAAARIGAATNSAVSANS